MTCEREQHSAPRPFRRLPPHAEECGIEIRANRPLVRSHA